MLIDDKLWCTSVVANCVQAMELLNDPRTCENFRSGGKVDQS